LRHAEKLPYGTHTEEYSLKRKTNSATAQSPKPAPDIKKLGYFVGKWKTKGNIAPGPWGAGGKFSWKETTEWMDGNFFVVGHWKFKMPPSLGGNGTEIFIMGYDTRQKVYTFDAFSSQGLHQVSRGKLKRNTWIWTSETFDGKKAIQQKMTMKVLSPISYTLKFELSPNGRKWMTFMEGKATKR
jgi:hypothetical protein